MIRSRAVLLSLLCALALTLAACVADAADESVDSEAPSSAPVAPALPSAAPSPSEPAGLPGASETAIAAPVGEGGASVTTGEVDQHGTVLTDGTGMTLYVFFEDSDGTSACYDACADNWPPLLTEGEPVAEGMANRGLLGTTQRDDGTMQVTYDGQPLYLFSGDSEPGQASGFGSGNVWYPVTPDGAPMDVTDQRETTTDGY